MVQLVRSELGFGADTQTPDLSPQGTPSAAWALRKRQVPVREPVLSLNAGVLIV